MIEVMALAGAVKGVSAAISSAIKAGKDISSLAGPLAKLMLKPITQDFPMKIIS